MIVPRTNEVTSASHKQQQDISEQVHSLYKDLIPSYTSFTKFQVTTFCSPSAILPTLFTFCAFTIVSCLYLLIYLLCVMYSPGFHPCNFFFFFLAGVVLTWMSNYYLLHSLHLRSPFNPDWFS